MEEEEKEEEEKRREEMKRRRRRADKEKEEARVEVRREQALAIWTVLSVSHSPSGHSGGTHSPGDCFR